MNVLVKPAPGSEEEKMLLAHYVHLCRQLHWHSAFRALGQETLLVIDAELKAAFEIEYGKFQCRTKSPEAMKKLPAGIERVFFLCRVNEWGKVKLARARWPKMPVHSLTYDIAPMGMLEGREFPPSLTEQANGTSEDFSTFPVPRNILISSEGSDSEYLSVLLEKNQILSVTPFAGGMLAPWIMLSKGFKLARFASKALRFARLRRGAVYLDLKLLQVLFRHTSLKRDRFFTWVNGGEGHVLYFISRDKARQMALIELLATADYKSLWGRSPATIEKTEGQQFDTASALDRLPGYLDTELRLEKPLQIIENFKVVSLEELVLAPNEVLQSVAQFWALKLRRRMQIINWPARYHLLPDFVAQLAVFRAELVKRFNLEDIKPF